MVKIYIFAALFLGVHLFSIVPVQGGNVYDNSEEESKEVSHSHTASLGYENTESFGFGNKSHYDRECNCGWGSHGCRYENNEKVCDCDWQYSQNGDECEPCDCGFFSSKCQFENNKKICTCFGTYKQNYYDKCTECDCGYDAISCDFKGNSKMCTCQTGYIVKSEKCHKCDCGLMALSCELTFDKYTRCTCKSGYVAERTTWESNEYCRLPGPSGWKIATYIESVFFALIILVCIVNLCWRKVLPQ